MTFDLLYNWKLIAWKYIDSIIFHLIISYNYSDQFIAIDVDQKKNMYKEKRYKRPGKDE